MLLYTMVCRIFQLGGNTIYISFLRSHPGDFRKNTKKLEVETVEQVEKVKTLRKKLAKIRAKKENNEEKVCVLNKFNFCWCYWSRSCLDRSAVASAHDPPNYLTRRDPFSGSYLVYVLEFSISSLSRR